MLEVKHRNLRDGPAVVGAGDLELYHRDGVRWAAHDAEAAANALLLVDDHISAAGPGFGAPVHRIALDHAREALHADTVVGADIDAAGAEDTDRGIDHDIQLALQAAARLLHSLLGRIAGFGLARIAIAVLERQGRDHFVRDRLIVIDHATTVVGQLDLFGWFGRLVLTAQVAVNRASGVAAIADRRDQVARSLGIVAAGEEAGVAGHPGLAIDQGHAIALVDLHIQTIEVQPGGVAVLAEGGNNHISRDDVLAALDWDRAATPASIGIAQLVANDAQAADVDAILAEHLDGRDQVLEFDMLELGLVHLILVGTHLLLRAAIEHIDLLGAKANRGAAAIHRGKATAQDDHMLAHEGRLAEVGPGEHRDAMLDTLEVCARNNLVVGTGQVVGDITAGGQVDRIILFEQIFHLDITTHARIIFHLHAEIAHIFGGLFGGHAARETPDGDAVDHYAASDGISLVDRHGIAHFAQVAGAGQAGRAGSHNCHLLVSGDRRRRNAMTELAVIGGGALEPANGDWLTIDLVATADRLTWAGTGASEHAGNNIRFAVEQIRLIETSLRDKTDISRDVSMGRAADLTGNIRLIPVGRCHDRLVSKFQFTIWINHSISSKGA